MIKKNIIFFLLLILLNNCSFDSKTGIWGDAEKERKRISKLEKDQKEIIKIEKIYSSDTNFKKEKSLAKSVNLKNPKKNSEWLMSSLNHQNFLGNLYLPTSNNTFLKKKIGKDKFSFHGNTTPLLVYKSNIIFADDTGTIFNINKYGKIYWKKNIYKKVYKKIYKNLVFSIYENNIYVADNIGFIYALNLSNGEITWIKNYGIPIRSNIKIFDNKIFLIDQTNKILCFNTEDGTLIWDIHSISSFIKSQNLLSIAVTKKGELFVITSSADLFKINSETGRIIWSRNTASTLYADATDFFNSSNLVIDTDKIFFSSDTSTYSLDLNTGNEIWVNQNVTSIATPVISGDNIFVVTNNGYLVILNKADGKIISSSNILKVLKRKNQETIITGFIMGSNKIYAITLNGFMIVSSANTGKPEYFKKIGGKNIAPLIINEEKLYVLTEDSKIFIFN